MEMDAQYLGMQFFMINVLRRNMSQKTTVGCELQHGQLPLLEALITHPDCTQQELSDTLRVTPASVAQSAARLERGGFLKKRVDPNNKRCNRLSVTPAGVQAAQLHRRCFDEINAFTFANLTDDELEQLSRLFHAILNNFGENVDDGPWPPRCREDVRR